MKHLSLLSLAGFIGILIFWGNFGSLIRSVTRNISLLSIVSSSPSVESLQPYWYGVGLRSVTKNQAEQILSTHFSGMTLGLCAEWEKETLGETIEYPWWPMYTSQDDYELRQLVARIYECNESFPLASDKLAQIDNLHIRNIWEIGLLNRTGNKRDAFDILVGYACPDEQTWCTDYFRAIWLSGPEQNALEDQFKQYSNHSEVQLGSNDIQSEGLLNRVSNSNLIVETLPTILETFNPIIVSGTLPKGDNYIQFAGQPVSGSVAKYRVRGEILGMNDESCIRPRMTFYSDGDYLGDSTTQYQVSGKFEVHHWLQIAPTATHIIPRISFDERCFTDNQRIVIYETELAFGH